MPQPHVAMGIKKLQRTGTVCLDGFDGDAWMSEVEGAQDDSQVGEAVGVNNRVCHTDNSGEQ